MWPPKLRVHLISGSTSHTWVAMCNSREKSPVLINSTIMSVHSKHLICKILVINDLMVCTKVWYIIPYETR